MRSGSPRSTLPMHSFTTSPFPARGWLWRRLLLAGFFGAAASQVFAVESVLVVASATTSRSASADYVCDGVADDVQIQQAVNALPVTGGAIYLTDGIFTLSANI